MAIFVVITIFITIIIMMDLFARGIEASGGRTGVLAKCEGCRKEWEIRKDLSGKAIEIKPKMIN